MAQAYLAGLTFALAASPCSTPVLATLLAYVAASQEPLLGGGLLLAYTSGCESMPLLVDCSGRNSHVHPLRCAEGLSLQCVLRTSGGCICNVLELAYSGPCCFKAAMLRIVS